MINPFKQPDTRTLWTLWTYWDDGSTDSNRLMFGQTHKAVIWKKKKDRECNQLSFREGDFLKSSAFILVILLWLKTVMPWQWGRPRRRVHTNSFKVKTFVPVKDLLNNVFSYSNKLTEQIIIYLNQTEPFLPLWHQVTHSSVTVCFSQLTYFGL